MSPGTPIRPFATTGTVTGTAAGAAPAASAGSTTSGRSSSSNVTGFDFEPPIANCVSNDVRCGSAGSATATVAVLTAPAAGAPPTLAPRTSTGTVVPRRPPRGNTASTQGADVMVRRYTKCC